VFSAAAALSARERTDATRSGAAGTHRHTRRRTGARPRGRGATLRATRRGGYWILDLVLRGTGWVGNLVEYPVEPRLINEADSADRPETLAYFRIRELIRIALVLFRMVYSFF
jgi:hypothetical protein